MCASLVVAAFAPAQTALTEVQIANLTVLGKVWGFLKYHHPAVTGGDRDWDRDLLQIVPGVLAAPDRASADEAMFRWLTDLGAISECLRCGPLLPKDAVLFPYLGWLNDKALLGSALSDLLQSIYRNRVPLQQWYVSLAPRIRNPEFPHEAAYAAMGKDFGLQILAVFRFWNAIEYWYPYRDGIGAGWDDVLKEYIPKIGLAGSLQEYRRGVMALAARIDDSHEYVFAPLASRPPEGTCILPIGLRFVENQAVIAGVLDESAGLARGDTVAGIDGASVSGLVEQLRPWYSASNEPAQLRDIAFNLTRGACGPAKLRVRHGGEEKTLDVNRVPIGGIRARWIDAGQSHELAGPAFRMLSGNISYLKISSLKAVDVREYLLAAQSTKGLIVDLRGVPSEAIWEELFRSMRPTVFARIAVGDLSNPGAFEWQEKAPPPGVQAPRYPLKTVILVDELTQSNVEYAAMAFRSVPGVLLVGSTTAGADGNVSEIVLPGNIRVRFTGTGIFYPDGRPTQRIGIAPDVRVTPTVAGIAAGRDEVLEAAKRQFEVRP